MTSKPKIAIIIGSTRPTRFADKPAQWILKQAKARTDVDVELVDLRDHPMPFFDEVSTNRFVPSQNPEAVRWQETIGKYDGFIFVVPEYNHSLPAVLKNALDQAYNEWNRKPFAAVGYGALGAARAVEHLRQVGVELQMVSTEATVHIGGGDFFTVSPFGHDRPIEEVEANLLPYATKLFDELAWWANATMAAKARAA